MKRLVNAIKNIARKYEKEVNLIMADDNVTLEYFVFRNGEKDLYKTLQIEEFKEKLKIIVYPEKIEKIVDIEGLDDILIILKKQSNVIPYTSDEINQIKLKYPKNTKIELKKMYDLQAPKPGTIGYVNSVDDIGQIHVNWENGSSLALTRIDEYDVLCPICGKPLKNKLNNVFKVGEIRPFAYANIVHYGTIKNIDEEKDIYTLEDIETKEIYKTCSEFVFLGDD